MDAELIYQDRRCGVHRPKSLTVLDEQNIQPGRVEGQTSVTPAGREAKGEGRLWLEGLFPQVMKDRAKCTVEHAGIGFHGK